MSDIVVLIRGGVFQGALSNSSGNRIMVVDYDDEDAAEVSRTFDGVKVDADLFQQITSGAED
jgi:hypothetical protein